MYESRWIRWSLLPWGLVGLLPVGYTLFKIQADMPLLFFPVLVPVVIKLILATVAVLGLYKAFGYSPSPLWLTILAAPILLLASLSISRWLAPFGIVGLLICGFLAGRFVLQLPNLGAALTGIIFYAASFAGNIIGVMAVSDATMRAIEEPATVRSNSVDTGRIVQLSRAFEHTAAKSGHDMEFLNKIWQSLKAGADDGSVSEASMKSLITLQCTISLCELQFDAKRISSFARLHEEITTLEWPPVRAIEFAHAVSDDGIWYVYLIR